MGNSDLGGQTPSKKSGYLLFTALVVLILAAIAVVAWMSYQNQRQVQSPTATTATEEPIAKVEIAEVENKETLDPIQVYLLGKEAERNCANEEEIPVAAAEATTTEENLDQPENPDTQDAQTTCIVAFYATVALETKSPQLCTLIEDELNQKSCFDNTYASLARSELSVEFCQKLSDENYRQPCSEEVYFYLAQNNPTESKKYCNKIKNTELQKLCLGEPVGTQHILNETPTTPDDSLNIPVAPATPAIPAFPAFPNLPLPATN